MELDVLISKVEFVVRVWPCPFFFAMAVFVVPSKTRNDEKKRRKRKAGRVVTDDVGK